MKRAVLWDVVIALLYCIGVCSFSGDLRAQAVGSITGTVFDPSGALVAGASVTAVEKDTNFTRRQTASKGGEFTLALLPVGTYTVTATAQGFKASTVQVKLDADQRREVRFDLQLASTASNVEVTATAPVIETTSGALGGVVQGSQVNTLPLNGRDVSNLVLMLPGVQAENNGTFSFNSTPSGNGNRGTTGAGYLDGMDSTDNELGGGQFTNFNLDAIAEVRVLQNNYGAQYGRGAGLIEEIVTKSGTNQLHGSLFEFLRNDVFDARNFFSTSNPPFRRNEFGAAVGGPIFIPHVYDGRNKTFFFFQEAYLRQRQAAPYFLSVPTPNERQGLVSIVGTGGVADTLHVPVVPAVSTILNAYPQANDPSGPYGARTFLEQFSSPTNRHQYSIRVDEHISEKDSLFFRFSNEDNVLPYRNVSLAILDPTFSAFLRNDWLNAGLSETHTFTPTLLNILEVSFMRTHEESSPRESNLTQVGFADGALSTWGPYSGGYSLEPLTFNVRDRLSWSKGRHSVNAGGEYRKMNASYWGTAGNGGDNGAFKFAQGTLLPVAIPSASGNNNLPLGAPSPNSLVSFMVGASQFYSRTVAYPGFGPSGGGYAPFSMRRANWSGWIQDDFRLTQSLTLNLGIRYEYNGVPWETHGRIATVEDNPASPLFGDYVLNPSPLYRKDYRGLAPRFGLAWKVMPKTVVRGGFGVFTLLPLEQEADQHGFNFPFAGSSTVSNRTFSATPLPLPNTPLMSLKGQVLPPGSGTSSVAPNTPIDLTNFAGMEENGPSTSFHNGYAMSGNFTLERELARDTVLQVGYVVNNAVGLFASEYPNGYAGAMPQYAPLSAVSPNLSEVMVTDNHGHSTYNSLQSSLRKTVPTAGMVFQLSYTYSKALDNATSVENAGNLANSAQSLNDPTCFRCEKGPASFDAAQRFVANFNYQIPLDRVESLPKRLRQGWALLGIITANSGFPFTITTPYGTTQYGVDDYNGGDTRPDLLQTPPRNLGGQGPKQQYFSSNVISNWQTYFGVPLVNLAGSTVQTHPGNLGRNTYRTSGYSNGDISLLKDTHINERIQMEFRAEFFNLLNQHAFSAPGTTVAASGFGVATGTLLSPRQLQFGLRFIF